MSLPRMIGLLGLGFATPLIAQDQDFFGAAVAFSGGDLLVVKPAAARGPAAVLVYRNVGGMWTRSAELRAPGALQRGQTLSQSLAAGPRAVMVGAGDPNGTWGAHVWAREGDTWTHAPSIAVGEAPGGDAPVTLATVMRVLSPTPRAVALHNDLALIGYQRGAHLFRWEADGWRRLPVAVTDGFSLGAAVAAGAGVGVVAQPLQGPGRVLVLEDSNDGWRVTDTLAPADLAPRSRFGGALALDGTTLAVGAPGAGSVIIYERINGAFREQARLRHEGAADLGTVLALYANELVASAPRSAMVVGYRRQAGEWVEGGILTAREGAVGGGFGLALTLGKVGVAVGAPFAHGGRGCVWVYARGATAPAELAPPGTPPSHAGEEIACTDGDAGGFRCSNVDMQAFLPIEALGGQSGERVSDIWGWTDPETGREYALVGRTSAMVMVDVTDATNPRVVGEMPANPSGARDIKVFRNHAFLTGDGAGQHGLMVFDLTRLRGVTGPPVTFAPDTVYRGIASAHNLAIDTVNALAVPVSASGGGETCGGGLHFVDISNPRAPMFAGCYTDTEGLIAPGRTHDVQCVRYHGPDAEHQGRNICFASNETALRIVDVTDRANPVPLSAGRYPGAAYIHQGWLTEDHRHFYLNDELDELVGTTDRTRTMIWDLADLDDPVMVGIYHGPDGATDHNLFIKGQRMYQANYQAGFRVIDISDPVAPHEVGFFDTTPYDGNPAGFYGAWTAYPYFASGLVIVSSMQEGLFVLKPRQERLVP